MSSEKNWTRVADAAISTLMIFGFLLSAFRYRETWTMFLMGDIIKVIMFSILIAYASPNTSVLSLILSITYFFNSLHALWVWRNSQKTEIFN